MITRFNSSTFKNAKRGSREMWAEVNRIRGTDRQSATAPEGVTATTLNQHYGNISTDQQYVQPRLKSTATNEMLDIFDEYNIFVMLEAVGRTATGPDDMPPWLLSRTASVLAEPITCLFNLSIRDSFVPSQWKMSNITPVPKVRRPATEADYRPISITPILCRVIERLVVRRFFYPILTQAHSNMGFSDQYAFRPTGSTSAALISITHQLAEMLTTHPYVHLVALDFSKAFDTVQHSYLAEQLAELPIPDNIYNWIIAFLNKRQHRTKFMGATSSAIEINASIVQGSGLGPVDFIVAISKLKPRHSTNKIIKYADDSYILFPFTNSELITSEFDHVTTWADSCNLKLNHSKIQEMIVRRPMRGLGVDLPKVTPGLTRVKHMKILGVTMSEQFNFDTHVNNIVIKARQSMYALRVLTAHGLRGQSLSDVTNATTVSRMLYAAPAWWGFVGGEGRSRLQATIRRLVRSRYLPESYQSFEQLCQKADCNLFSTIISNPAHVLHQLLPPVKTVSYSLRPRTHNRIIPKANSLSRKTFVTRMLYT